MTNNQQLKWQNPCRKDKTAFANDIINKRNDKIQDGNVKDNQGHGKEYENNQCKEMKNINSEWHYIIISRKSQDIKKNLEKTNMRNVKQWILLYLTCCSK